MLKYISGAESMGIVLVCPFRKRKGGSYGHFGSFNVAFGYICSFNIHR